MSFIVIRILPQGPVDAATFTNYLNPSLGGLQITAFDLSFNSPTSGQNVGSASYVGVPSTLPSPTVGQFPWPAFQTPQYTPDPASGIVQQYDMMPFSFPDSPFFQLQSVATAVITVPSVAKFENLRLVVKWGVTSIPMTMDFYDVEVQPGNAPDLNAWAPNLFATTPQPDP